MEILTKTFCMPGYNGTPATTKFQTPEYKGTPVVTKFHVSG